MPIRNRRVRRAIGGALVAGGALLMWLAPDYTVAGAVLMGAAIVLELIGISLEHSGGK